MNARFSNSSQAETTICRIRYEPYMAIPEILKGIWEQWGEKLESSHNHGFSGHRGRRH
jgi:hypothetical protein